MANTVEIDYWGLVGRSLRIVWKHKFLWFFGFFASVSGGNSVNWAEKGGGSVRQFLLAHPVLLLSTIVALVVLWLVLFAMNLVSKSALIASVREVDEDRPVAFGAAWRAGLRPFWRVLGLTVLAVLAFLVVSALCVIPVILPLVAGAPGIVVALIVAAVLFFPYVGFLFALAFTVTYGEREIVLEGAAVFDAIRGGWELTRRFFWKSVVVWLVMLLSGLVYVLGLGFVFLFLAVPFVIIGLSDQLLALALGIPVGLVILAVATGAYGTYAYSVWTLAYRELKRGLGPDARSPLPEPPPFPGVSHAS